MGSSGTAGRLVGWALDYAARGWPVFPVATRRKRPLTNTGCLEASTDPAQVKQWWTRWPTANIGLRTGVAFDVLDIDGEVGLTSLEAKAGPGLVHPGPVSRTAHGIHWLFLPGDTANQQKMLGPKVDWRGTNGYIVAPPSVHPEGFIYAWADDHGPDTDIPPVPDWLAPLLKPWVKTPDPAPILVYPGNPHQRARPQVALAYNMPPVIEGRLIDIVDLATRMGYDPQRDGRLYAIHCPFHEGDREPSLKLYPADNSFYCYGCGAWGDSLNLRDHRPGGRRAQG